MELLIASLAKNDKESRMERRRAAIAISSFGLLVGILLTIIALGNLNSYNFAAGLCSGMPQDCVNFHTPPPPIYLLVSLGASAISAAVSAVGLGVSVAYHQSRNPLGSHP